MSFTQFFFFLVWSASFCHSIDKLFYLLSLRMSYFFLHSEEWFYVTEGFVNFAFSMFKEEMFPWGHELIFRAIPYGGIPGYLAQP